MDEEVTQKQEGFFSRVDGKLRQMGKDWKTNAPARKKAREDKLIEKGKRLDAKIQFEKKRNVLDDIKLERAKKHAQKMKLREDMPKMF